MRPPSLLFRLWSLRSLCRTSPPGEAQLAQWFDGSFTWQVTSLDEGRNAPEHVLLASFSYDAGTSADDTHPDLKIIGEPVMCDPSSGERSVYGCSYDNEAVASSSSSPMLSHRITETQADALREHSFPRRTAPLSTSGLPPQGNVGSSLIPSHRPVEPNGFSAEKGTCSNLRIG